jgi:hypothetical protein
LIHIYGKLIHIYGKLIHIYGKLIHIYGNIYNLRVFGLWAFSFLLALGADIVWNESTLYASLQGGLENSKISGMGTSFGLLVHVLPGPNKQREAKPSILLS